MKIGALQMLQSWAGLADNILRAKRDSAEIKATRYQCNLEFKFHDCYAVSSREDEKWQVVLINVITDF